MSTIMPNDLRDVRTKSAALDLFRRQGSPPVLATALVGLVGARSGLRRFGGRDVAAVVGVVAIRPFAEWIIHSQILHAPVRHMAGRGIDTAADHLRHHAEPALPGPVLLQRKYAIAYSAVVALIGAGITEAFERAVFKRRWQRPSVTAASTAAATLLAYEWTHFLIHTNVPARTRWLRNRRQHHRAHHYRDDTRWYGVTSSFADRVLGTGDK